MRRAVFLDRDGVLNAAVVRDGKPYPPASLDQLVILPGVKEALSRLRTAGWLLLVATNQPDVARGTQRKEIIEDMHAHLRQCLPLDGIYACYEDGAECHERKPNPGMLLRAAREWNVALGDSVMVGDRWRDIEAGRRAGCRTVFVEYDYREKKPQPPADLTVPNLAAAVDWILALRTEQGDVA